MKTVNEQTVYELFDRTFSAVMADSNGLKQKIMEKQQISQEKHRKRRRFLPFKIAFASVLVLALSVTTYAAAVGGFAELLERVSLTYGDVVEPVSVVKEDQGIRLEVVAAQRYGNEAVLYMTVEDTTGQGQVDETTVLSPELIIPHDVVTHYSIYTDNLYYIEEIGKAVFETRIRSDHLPEKFTIYLEKMATVMKEINNGTVEINIKDNLQVIGNPAMKESGGAGADFLESSILARIPGTADAYVSAVGISDGWFCVQTAIPEEAGYDIWPCLMDSNGNVVDSHMSVGNFAGKFSALFNDLSCSIKSKGVLRQESYFDIDVNQVEQYKIFYKGTQSNVLSGDWTVDINLENVEQAISGTGWYENKKVLSGNDSEGTETFSGEITVILNPLGLTVTGYNDYSVITTAELKTTSGPVKLQFSSNFLGISNESSDPNKTLFEAYFSADEPINLNTVTEIWIDENLIWKKDA